jgi:hypothetical protein
MIHTRLFVLCLCIGGAVTLVYGAGKWLGVWG